MCVWTEPVSHTACYINLAEMVVEGADVCVDGASISYSLLHQPT